MKNILSACCILFTLTVLNAQQTAVTARDIPHTISYQGLLTDSLGEPLRTDTYTMVVRLYSDPNAVKQVWQDTFNVDVNNGIFNIVLGSGNVPLPGGDIASSPLWLGVQMEGRAEMRPLTQFTAAPYALGVADSAITTQKLRDNSVTAEKIGTNYVSGVAVNGN